MDRVIKKGFFCAEGILELRMKRSKPHKELKEGHCRQRESLVPRPEVGRGLEYWRPQLLG